MNDLTEFQQRAVAVGIMALVSGRYFSICDLDAIGKVLGRTSHLAGPEYNALRLLHCIDWADMGPELAQQARECCLTLLGLPSHVLDQLQPQARAEPPSAPARRLRLAFWKKAE